MSLPLFRPEVMQARQASWLGGIRMGRNPGFSLVAGVALALAGALVAFAAWGQVARKARIPGVLMPVQGTVQLSANAAGVLTEQLVQEGEHVTAGQALFVLSTDRPTASRGHGLATCPQEYWSLRHRSVSEFVGAPENEMLFCGIAVGHADGSAAINSLRSHRMDVDEFARFV